MNVSTMSSIQCFKIFHKEPNIKRWDRAALLACLITEFFFIIISSTMLIYALVKTNRILSITTKLFIYLSTCDLWIGLCTIPLQLFAICFGSRTPCAVVGVQAFSNSFFPLVSTWTIVTLTVLRYLAIKKPLIKVHNGTVLFALFMQLLLSVGFSSVYVYYSMQPQLSTVMGIYLIVVSVFIFFVIGNSILLNFTVHMALRHKRENVIRTQSMTRNIRQKEASNTLLILLILLSICYLPNGISFLTTAYNILSHNLDKDHAYRLYTPWTHNIMLLNSGFNSFAYIMRTRKIRQFYANLLCRKYNRTNSQITTRGSTYCEEEVSQKL